MGTEQTQDLPLPDLKAETLGWLVHFSPLAVTLKLYGCPQ